MLIDQNKITDVSQIRDQAGYIRYSRDMVHGYSRAIGEFLDFFLHHLEDAFTAKQRGKDVVWTGFMEPSFLYACDAVPLEITNMARLCPSEAIKRAEEYFQTPAETCVMYKAKMGGFYAYRDCPCKQIVYGSFGCEPQFAGDVLAQEFGFRGCVFDLSKIPEDASKQQIEIMRTQYRDELQRVAKWINGKEIAPDKLREEMLRANRIGDKAAYLQELQKKHPAYMRSLPSMLVTSGRNGYYGQPERYEVLLDNIIAEFEELPEGAYCEPLVEIVWNGARGVDFSVFNSIDTLGGCIVGWTIAGSGRRKYDLTKDPLEAYVDFHMRGQFTRGMREQCEAAEKLYRETGAAGVILYVSQGCTHMTVGLEMRRKYLSEKNVPTLALAGAAKIGEETGQVRTRIKAFLEMIS